MIVSIVYTGGRTTTEASVAVVLVIWHQVLLINWWISCRGLSALLR